MREVTAYVALGSNLGDRAGYLDAGIAGLAATAGVRVVREAPRRETHPVGGPAQGDFLNSVACLATTLAPELLLARLHAVEAQAGRRRGPERNAARTLDLDLLFYADDVIDRPGLVVPHPRLHERSFVLDPLCELAPDFIHPLLGVSIRALAQRVREGAANLPGKGVRASEESSWPS